MSEIFVQIKLILHPVLVGMCAKLLQSRLIVCNPMDRSLPSFSAPGTLQNPGVGCHALLQGIFLTLGSNLCLLCPLRWQLGSLPLEPARRKSKQFQTQVFCCKSNLEQLLAVLAEFYNQIWLMGHLTSSSFPCLIFESECVEWKT